MAKISKEEEEFRKLSVEMRFLEQTAETLQQRISIINAAMTDLTYANMTLESVEKVKEDVALLVPIGGNSHVQAKLANSNKVLVGIGAGVSVEKTLQEAKAIVKERKEQLEKTMTSVQQQFAQVANRINVDRNRLESLLSIVREGKA